MQSSPPETRASLILHLKNAEGFRKIFLKGSRLGCVKPGGVACFDGISTIMLALCCLVFTWNACVHEPMAGNERKSDIADT